jgi:hypothetical protein
MCDKCDQAWAMYNDIEQWTWKRCSTGEEPSWTEYTKITEQAFGRYVEIVRANHPPEARE